MRFKNIRRICFAKNYQISGKLLCNLIEFICKLKEIEKIDLSEC
jgi:hypothetical protein